MSSKSEESSLNEETDSDRWRGLLAEEALSLELVSAFSGDRALSLEETAYLHRLQSMRRQKFFSDILYAITHQYFAPEVAKTLWVKIVHHKQQLSLTLKRNVRIVVAALDYLSNVTEHMEAATLVSEAQIGQIVGLSLRDGLTGLFNHTYFYQQIEMEMRRHLRYDVALTLVLIDVDDFKAVNDQFGHAEGDRVLAAIGRSILQTARDADICCRYGGEEFAVILLLTDLPAGTEIANRMLKEVAERLPGGQMVTVSIGVALCTGSIRTSRELVDAADQALYQAKREGKNRVIVANS